MKPQRHRDTKMIDNYEHPQKQQVYYVLENIPGPADESEEFAEIFNNYHSQLTTKCDCENYCLDQQCACIINSQGRNYTSSKFKDLKTYNLNISNKSKVGTIIECNDFCSCINFCGNRLVQKGPSDGLFVRHCEIQEKGIGLYTKNLIDKGSFVCEYAGELLTKSQAFKRQQLNIINKRMNFIFCLNEFCNGKVTQTFVDPSCFGNIGRYINHSCDPNCSIIPVRINCPIPKLAIFSRCEILPDQELTIDYGTNNCNTTQVENNIELIRTKCICNSNKCRGNLPFESYL